MSLRRNYKPDTKLIEGEQNPSASVCTPQLMTSALEAEKDSERRIGFFTALRHALRNRAGLADEHLIASIVKIAINDLDFNVSRAAYSNLSVILQKRSDLANAALNVVASAIRSKDINSYRSALWCVGAILEKRPDLANEALVASVVKGADNPDSYVRLSTQRTLGVILDKRPRLVNAALVAGVLTAVRDAHRPVRKAGQRNFCRIAAKRPDLLAAASPGKVLERVTIALRSLPT